MRLALFLTPFVLLPFSSAAFAAPDTRVSDGGGSTGTSRCVYDLPSSGWRGVGYGVPPQNFMRPCHASGTTREDQLSAEEELLAQACWQMQAIARQDRPEECQR